ncbi:MAG: flagellar export chaperone FliS [Perlucidibaca sp.]
MGYGQAARAYADIGRHASVEAASPHRLIQMLFDGALDRIASASGCIARHDVSGKGHEIGRAVRIVEGLRMSLDRTRDDALTANLDELYDYIGRRLLQANISGDDRILAECAHLLRELKTAWDAIPEGYHHGGPVESAMPMVMGG